MSFDVDALLLGRFWAKVDKGDEAGCWLWTACRSPQGYGLIKVPRGVTKAHLLSWEMLHGAIPNDHVVKHTCGVRRCVRPDHLAVQSKLDMQFWSRVASGGPGDCWVWTGAIMRDGYGKLSAGRGGRLAHRASWILANGPIPEGLHVCHRCDNPPCVNPAHLFLGTHLDNMRDKKHKGRSASVVGVANPNAKISERIVRAIRQEHAREATTKAALARKYGVTYAIVSLLLERRTWRHVA